jgi:hypothetical protein
MPIPNRLIVSTSVSRLFAPFEPEVRRSAQPAAALRARLVAAAPAARRIGVVQVASLGLSLPVYRAVVQQRDYDIVVRRDAAGAHRVVGLVPVRAAGAPATPSGRGVAAGTTEREATVLALELLGAETEEELDYFLGKIFKKVASVAKGIEGVVGKVTRAVGKAVDTVNKFVPIKSVMNLTSIGLAARALEGARQVARGKNVFKVARNLVQDGVKDLGNVLSAASMVTSFIPGIGPGVAAALGAAGALAQGQRLTDALLAAARAAIPGGALAQTAFDLASGLVKGQSLSQAALSAARQRLPGGPAALAAFDAGLALAQGKKLQDVAIATAGRVLPRGPGVSAALAVAGAVP